MAGRKPFLVDDAVCSKAEQLAAQGLTLEQIALSLGICYKTLNVKKKAFSSLSEALKRGQAKGIAQITNKLYQKALTGDNTAMIFFLKCRDRENWSEQKQESSAATEIAGALLDIADRLPT
jgi:alpha-D-ribose 1-methylphosphonate 5-triphosphate diphosphatase PhnM